jgi:hypothetical protein
MVSEPQRRDGRYLLSPVNERKLRLILARMLDESEFLSDYGIRAVSHNHQEHVLDRGYDAVALKIVRSYER